MYESFFGFERPPFNNTPDTSFYFPSERHNEALAQLLYTVTARKGFAVLTGEIGSGKTTLCRSMLKQMDEDTVCALITNPRLTGIQLLYSVAREFHLDVDQVHRVAILDAINEFLIEMLAQDKNVILIIDEAQNLPLSTLEEVRLISNLETETEKLIQILLLGQPELRRKLEHPSLLQLRQRIAMRFHLTALDQDEMLQYIQHRMRIAGPHHRVRFSSRALAMIYRYSGGVPRLVNLLCDRVLITAFTMETNKVAANVVLTAIREIEGPDWNFKRAAAEEKEAKTRKSFLRLPFFASKTR
ncbi:MAG: tRNA (adenosine(37)-N6)-threonylcarbamoyltransferase complex ATPase subunit type 1 TsaE [Planctomycetes bacterium]|nr:tRNA (adenosine(37)-N6)-threonylcarbamoyltransferase complex ATPase subunit type 1 TsaE [Planctomycetota bacterium]